MRRKALCFYCLDYEEKVYLPGNWVLSDNEPWFQQAIAYLPMAQGHKRNVQWTLGSYRPVKAGEWLSGPRDHLLIATRPAAWPTHHTSLSQD